MTKLTGPNGTGSVAVLGTATTPAPSGCGDAEAGVVTAVIGLRGFSGCGDASAPGPGDGRTSSERGV